MFTTPGRFTAQAAGQVPHGSNRFIPASRPKLRAVVCNDAADTAGKGKLGCASAGLSAAREFERR